MKAFIFFCLLMTNAFSFDSKIAGEIWWSQKERGNGEMREAAVITVSAYSNRDNKKILVAQTTIKKPSFPQLFLLGPRQTIDPSIPFEGPFEIEIQYKDGAIQKQGVSNSSEIENGNRKNIFFLKE